MLPVKLEDIHFWLEQHPEHTWNYTGVIGEHRVHRTKAVKYLTLSFDTRSMDIYRLTASGLRGEIVVDFRDVGEGNILDGLDRAIARLEPKGLGKRN